MSTVELPQTEMWMVKLNVMLMNYSASAEPDILFSSNHSSCSIRVWLRWMVTKTKEKDYLFTYIIN